MQRRRVDVNDYQQLAISGAMSSHSTEAWGDSLMAKSEGICRLGLLNPSGFTLMGRSAKDDLLRALMRTMEVDVMCFPEVNICWHKLAPHNRLEERTMGWFETMHRSVSYNFRDQMTSRHQFGGTAIFSINNAASRVMGTGRDATGLGRWTWT
jgi:hypothetical protein